MGATDVIFAGSIPGLYDRYLGPMLFEPYAAVIAERAKALQPKRILETAAGTGVVTAVLHAALPEADIVATDLNQSMLDVASERVRSDNVRFSQADAQSLPFPDDSFDLVTIAFGLRNVTDKDAALREMLRVLKVGGQARVLEFSQVKADWFKPIYDFHSFNILPRLGKLFARDAGSYQYLAESIRQHPPQETLKAMMQEAGFERCDFRNLNAGIVAIHTGYKV